MMTWILWTVLAWVGVSALTALVRMITGALLRRRTSQLSRLRAEVHGLLQREQHLRRLCGEIDGSRRVGGASLLLAPRRGA